MCGRSFAVAARLRRHKASHAGVKPFKCPLCEYTSNRAGIQQLIQALLKRNELGLKAKVDK